LAYRKEFCGKTKQLDNSIKKHKTWTNVISKFVCIDIWISKWHFNIKKKKICFQTRKEFLVKQNSACFTVTLTTKAITAQAQYKYFL